MPASVAALHACLEELASAIEAQKKVLADLEHTRIAIRRQLNGLCDPITRLPLEISSEIFIQCLNSTSLSPPNPSVAPLLLLNISNSWTNIALSTTALWADLALDISSTRFRATEQCTEFFSRWLCRARARPLALSLHGFASPEIAITVAGHALQMRELLLVVPRRAQLEVFPDGKMFPSLTKLSISDFGGSPYSVVEAARIFQSSPNLLECTLQNRLIASENPTGVHVVHSCLQVLNIRGDVSGGDIIQFITLPALNSLEISFEGGDVDDLIPFLTRSSPPLKRLTLDPGNTTWTQQTIEHCFGLTRGLTHLELRGSADFQDYAIVILGDSPSTFLSNLTHFTIVTGPFSDNGYVVLVSMLSARRTNAAVKLQSFRLELDIPIHDDEVERPELQIPQNVKHILRSLIADGMEIYIGHGPGGTNLLNLVDLSAPSSLS